MYTAISALAAAVVGLLIGPALVAWAQRAPRSAASLPAASWWRGGEATVGVVVTVSAITGLLLALVMLRYAGSATWPAWCWLVVSGAVLAMVDLRHRRLPYQETGAMATGGMLAFTGAAIVEGSWSQFITAISSALAVLVVAAAIQLLFPRHTGGGDTLLYGALALYLGWHGASGLLRGLLLATGLTAIVALGVWAIRGQASARFPAGPSLISGTLVAVLIE